MMADPMDKSMVSVGLEAFEIECAELLENIESNLLVLEKTALDFSAP